MSPAGREAAHAWADYVSQINERFDPRDGWASISQLPLLRLADMGLCLRAHPDLLDDIGPDADALADSLSTGDFGTVQEDLAVAYLAQLAQAVRKRLFADLQIHAEQLELAAATAQCERMHMTDAQYAAHIRGVEYT